MKAPKPRTLFAFMFYATTCYMIIAQQEVPKFLENLVMILMGFYFGQKVKKRNGG